MTQVLTIPPPNSANATKSSVFFSARVFPLGRFLTLSKMGGMINPFRHAKIGKTAIVAMENTH
jgi:hypothetical protein